MSNVQDVRLSELIKPSPKQRECIQATDSHRFTLYGGAGGGGKSYLLRWWLLRQLIKLYAETGITGLVAGMFSMDYPTLQDRQISKIEKEFPSWLGRTKRTEKEGLCFFVNPEYGGGRIALRNLADPGSYKSAEFCAIAIEELSENKRNVLEDLILFRLRTPGVDRPCFLGGTNPTGVGMQWIKALWIDRKFPKELEHLKEEFVYVPALLKDNPHLGPEYEASMRGLPEKKRRALLEGDWTIPEGQYFVNFEPSERRVHSSAIAEIVKPWWPRWIGQDWGFKHHSPVYWHTVGDVMPEQAEQLLGRRWSSPKKCVFTYREHVESISDSGGSEMQLGRTVWEKSKGEKIKRWFMSSDAFGTKTTQRPPATLLNEGAGNGIGNNLWQAEKGEKLPVPEPCDMTPGSRVAGWRFMYQLIQNDTWFISDRCPLALDAIPALEYDTNKDHEDILKTDSVFDDVADCLRYSLADMLNGKAEPWQHRMETAVQQAFDAGGGTRAHMTHLKMLEKYQPKKKFGRQYT
jgi:hypothetical protein